MKNKFLKLHDIKQLTKVSGSKVYQMVESKQFPKPIKIGHRSVRWVREEVNEWVKKQGEQNMAVDSEPQTNKEKTTTTSFLDIFVEAEEKAKNCNYFVRNKDVPTVNVLDNMLNKENRKIEVEYKGIHAFIGDIDLELRFKTEKGSEKFTIPVEKQNELFTTLYTAIRAYRYENNIAEACSEVKKKI